MSTPELVVVNQRLAKLETKVFGNPPPSPSPPPPPPAAVLPRIGITLGGRSLFRSDADRAFELGQCAALGAKFLRLDCSQGAQTYIDRYLTEAAAHGLSALLCLGGSQKPTQFPSVSSYATFCADQAKRYPQVKTFELLNEPNLNGWGAQAYAAWASAAYTAAKAARPDAVFLAGGLGIGGSAAGAFQWAKTAYAAGLAGHFDGFSFHASDDPAVHAAWSMVSWMFGPVDAAVTDCMRAVLDRGGDASKPLVLSEYDIPPMPKYSEADSATFLTKALKDQRWPLIAAYTVMDDDVPGFGMLRTDRSKRPSWSAYRAVASVQ